MLSKFLICFLTLAFICGQVVRLQIGDIGITFFDISITLIVVVWFLYKGGNKKWNSIFGKNLYKKFLVFIAVGVLSLSLAYAKNNQIDIVTSILYPIRLVLISLLYFPLRLLSQKNKQFLILDMIFGGVCILVIGFVQFFFYPYLGNLYHLGWDDHLFRLFSTFLDPNFAAAFFSIFLVFILELFFNHRGRARILFSALMIATFTAILLTYSRTGILMMIISVSIYLLLTQSKKVVFAGIGICMLFFILSANTKIEGLNPLRVASTTARIQSAEIATKIFLSEPLLGVGFNAYRYAQQERGYRSIAPRVQSHADSGTDNSYLFILATTGIVGMGTALFFLYGIYFELRKSVAKNMFLSKSFFAAFLAVLIGSIFLNVGFYSMILCFLIAFSSLIQQKKP
ncbi:MAG: O-antigen ligase family protein [Candidatus Levybacteria bacterium]|nr:O-antigen ligase family protein [Candidatus Levybacteria bacterium]